MFAGCTRNTRALPAAWLIVTAPANFASKLATQWLEAPSGARRANAIRRCCRCDTLVMARGAHCMRSAQPVGCVCWWAAFVFIIAAHRQCSALAVVLAARRARFPLIQHALCVRRAAAITRCRRCQCLVLVACAHCMCLARTVASRRWCCGLVFVMPTLCQVFASTIRGRRAIVYHPLSAGATGGVRVARQLTWLRLKAPARTCGAHAVRRLRWSFGLMLARSADTHIRTRAVLVPGRRRALPLIRCATLTERRALTVVVPGRGG